MIDAVVAMGVGDRDRFAIAGHSYGAFTTVSLLAHSDLFRAGIARSGAAAALAVVAALRGMPISRSDKGDRRAQ